MIQNCQQEHHFVKLDSNKQDLEKKQITNNTKKAFVVKASFKECAISDRKTFPRSRCIIPISIGQKVHEGEKFSATLSLVNRSFKTCTILIDDSIQRFTLNIFEPERNLEELSQIAILAGDDWLKRNKFICEKLTIPYKTTRWEDFTKHQDFLNFHQLVSNLYAINNTYKKALEKTISAFLHRYLDRLNKHSVNMKHAFDNCLAYLKEECAVMCLWAKEGYDFEVYPSGRNQAMTATHEQIICPMHQGYLKSVGIRFKKYYKSI